MDLHYKPSMNHGLFLAMTNFFVESDFDKNTTTEFYSGSSVRLLEFEINSAFTRRNNLKLI